MKTQSAHRFAQLVRLGLVGLGVALFVANVFAVSAAGTRYAKPTATGTGDCSSWDNACTLQTALTGATSGDKIWVAAGTYSPTTGTDRNATFELKTGVAVYGGFAATETLLTQRDWRTNVTTLSGDIGTIGTDTDNSYHVVTSSGTDSSAVLDGFTITKGYRTTTGDGAGVYNVGGSPTLVNLIITANYVWSSGAGMYTENGNPELTNITFSNNTVPNGAGGGLYVFGGTPILTDVTFESNVGSGMAIGNSNATLSNVTFYNNYCPKYNRLDSIA